MQNKARLLFVDDEERVVNLLRTVFRGRYEVHTATSGPEALEIAAVHPIDVIVSDQRMPGMRGIELLSEMRKRSPATMRILLTGYSDLAAIVGSVNEGEVFRFINKPWNHEEIKRAVAEAAEAARASAKAVATTLVDIASPMDLSGPPGVLVIDDAAADRQAIADALGDRFVVHGAADIAAALKVLEERNIGVIVCEAQIGGTDVGDLLRILKHHHPTVTSVMLTNAADSELIVKLINGAQIFRFGVKPVRGSALRLAVAAAMREHQRMCARPALIRRHRVDAPPVEPENESLMASVVTSLGRLRARFHRFAGLVH